jgi:endonuclease III
LESRSSTENPLPRLQPLQPQKSAGRIAVHHLQHQDRRSELPQHVPLAGRNLSNHYQIAEAPAEYIARPIASGGLSNQKAKTIRDLFDIIVEKFGEPTLKPLSKMSDEDAENFLLSLPGVGNKVTRCVLMHSLGRQVFPVDTHCWRIARHLGWVRPMQKDKHCAPRDMDRL